MKNRGSWLVMGGVALALGAYVAYYAFLHDWRGSFIAEQLSLEARVSGNALTLVLSNAGPSDLIVYDSPGLGSPFEITLEGADGRAIRPAASAQGAPGSARRLVRGTQLPRSLALRALFPDAAPGRYTLRAAYDPAGAAGRKEPCAAELTLGRVEAPPLEVTLPPSR